MRLLLFVLANILPLCWSYGQSRIFKPDSLKAAIGQAKEDTIKVDIYLRIGQGYQDHNVDSATFYYNLAGALSERINYPVGTIKYLANLTELLNRQGKYDQALSLNLKAVAIAEKKKLRLELGKSYFNVGASYHYKKQYEQSIRYYLKAKAILEAMRYEDGVFVIYSNLCGLYEELGEYDKALGFADKSIVLAKAQGNTYGQASGLLNKGVALAGKKMFREALQVNEEGYELSKQLKSLYLQRSALSNISEIHLHQRLYHKAMTISNEVLRLARVLGDRDGEADALSNLSTAWLHLRNYPKSRLYAEQALHLSVMHRLVDSQLEALDKLATVALAMGNLSSYEKFKSRRDSLQNLLINEKVRSNVQELEVKYEAENKENEIRRLQQERTIQTFVLERANFYNTILICCTLSLAGFGFLLHRNYRNQKVIGLQTQRLHNKQIKELEQAQQIQTINAILKGQEAERTRLSKDLHDGLGGMLSGIKMKVHNLKLVIQSHEDDCAYILKQLDNTITELRRVAHSLMPDVLTRFGLVQALQDYCNDLTRSCSLAINFCSTQPDLAINGRISIVIYRIVQELITNAVKHAKATSIYVQLIRCGDVLTVTVEDDGVGFDTTLPYDGIGLQNIRSRVQYLKGSIDIHSIPGVGSTVTIIVNLETAAIF